jgi:hypothetical protein
MAVITVVNYDFLKDRFGGSRKQNQITQREQCIVEFSAPVTNIIDAFRISGFLPGSPHREKQELLLNQDTDADVHDDTNAAFWIFDLSYTTRPLQSSSAVNDDEYVPEVSFSKWSYPVVVDRDKETNVALKNTAGDPYDPLPVTQVSAPILHITVKEFSAHLERIPLIGSINSANIEIAGVSIPQYCGMLDDYQPEPYYDEEGHLTFKNRFSIKLKYFRNEAGQTIGFKLESLQAGFNQIVDGDKVEIRVADPEAPTDRSKDVPVAEPQLLDQNGALTETPYYVENVIDDLYDFGLFNLPTAYPAI